MRQLLPHLLEATAPEDGYRDLTGPEGRPTVRVNMIASADGAAAFGGTSGALGGPADQRVFQALRGLADLVLVGAGTMRAEGYGPSDIPVAVVTRSCRLPWEAPFFSQQRARPLVVTCSSAPAEERQRAADVADVIVAGEQSVDLAGALRALAGRGFRRVLGEGGPTLNGRLLALGLIDELCLTLAPRLAGGDAGRILTGAAPSDEPWGLWSVAEEDGFLFLRWRPIR